MYKYILRAYVRKTFMNAVKMSDFNLEFLCHLQIDICLTVKKMVIIDTCIQNTQIGILKYINI